MANMIKTLRLAQGMTQKQLSEKAKVPKVCITRYETKGSGISMANALKLAAALGVTVDELIRKGEG